MSLSKHGQVAALGVLVLAALPGRGAYAADAKDERRLTPARAAAVSDGVRVFMRNVAQDVTEHGPTAWLRHFDQSPEFFMAVNGQMAFPNSAAAREGTNQFARTISHIELKWGDLRVDPLADNLAVVAASWKEVQVDNAGHSVDETGYFTAVAEYRDSHWQFRDAHWSSPVAPAK